MTVGLVWDAPSQANWVMAMDGCYQGWTHCCERENLSLCLRAERRRMLPYCHTRDLQANSKPYIETKLSIRSYCNEMVCSWNQSFHLTQQHSLFPAAKLKSVRRRPERAAEPELCDKSGPNVERTCRVSDWASEAHQANYNSLTQKVYFTTNKPTTQTIQHTHNGRWIVCSFSYDVVRETLIIVCN